MMNIRCVLEWDDVVKGYSVYCPELSGLASCGDTEEEAMSNFREAVDLYFERDADIPSGALVKEMVI